MKVKAELNKLYEKKHNQFCLGNNQSGINEI